MTPLLLFSGPSLALLLTCLILALSLPQGLHVDAHCLREKPGGVTVLVINANRHAPQSLDIPMAAERYTIAAGNLLNKEVQLNGNEISLGANDALP